MTGAFLAHIESALADLKAEGFHKTERVLTSPQSARISVAGGQEVLNFCANNYLGLANDPTLLEAGCYSLVANSV